MGYMRHHAIIVTADTDRIRPAFNRAVSLFGGLVSALVPAAVNDYRTFIVAPDGSKEGWDVSDDHDRKRHAFIDWINGQRWADGSTPYKWAEVQYGDDAGVSYVPRHSELVEVSDDYAGPVAFTVEEA